MSERLSEKAYLTPEETAELLGISIRTVKRHLQSGAIPGVKVGRFWRVARAELDRALLAARQRPKRRG